MARLGGGALRLLAAGVWRLSPGGAGSLGTFLGRVMLMLTPHRRRVARQNISFALPEKSEEERERILRQCYENIGKSLVEFLRLPYLWQKGSLDEVISLEGEEHLRAALKKGRGVILLTAHYGNWELVGARLTASGYPLNVIARHQRDSGTTQLVNGVREAAGMRVLAARRADSSEILRRLRQNEIVGLLADQNAGRKGLFVDFFGRPASTHAGAALFALRSRAAVVPVFGLRNEDGTHTARLLPEVELVRTGRMREDVEANTARFSRIIEEQIRARPGLWFWLHERWRTRPRRQEKSDGN